MAPLKLLALCYSMLAPLATAITNPISVASAVIIGNQTSNNYVNVTRDGGWESQIGSTYFQFYADTETCDQHITNGTCHGFAANTLAMATSKISTVHDVGEPDSNNNPVTLCNSPVSGYRLHLTNIVPISGSSTQGVAWYTNISSDTSKNIDGEPAGSGVAIITYSNSKPSCTVYNQFWGTSEPNWGDHGITVGIDGYAYIMGSLADTTDNDVFLARVVPGSATSYSAYQYWNGTAFQAKTLTNPDYNGYAPSSVMQGIQQGSLIYSPYYKLFMYVYPNGGFSGNISAIVASQLQGPWSSSTVLYNGPYISYSPCPQTHFDTTGKSIVMTFAIFEETVPLKVLNVTFH